MTTNDFRELPNRVKVVELVPSDTVFGYSIVTGSGGHLPASPFEVSMWFEIVRLRTENEGLVRRLKGERVAPAETEDEAWKQMEMAI